MLAEQLAGVPDGLGAHILGRRDALLVDRATAAAGTGDDRSSDLHRAGEPLVRSLLRHVPGRRRDQVRADGTPKACIPDAALGHCSRPYHSSQQIQYGGPHDNPSAITDINNGAMDGFVEGGGVKPRACASDRFDPKCTASLGPDDQADVLSYHTRADIPNYWAYAKRIQLEDHMFAPVDSWTLPAHLFLVSAWSASCPTRPIR